MTTDETEILGSRCAGKNWSNFLDFWQTCKTPTILSHRSPSVARRRGRRRGVGLLSRLPFRLQHAARGRCARCHAPARVRPPRGRVAAAAPLAAKACAADVVPLAEAEFPPTSVKLLGGGPAGRELLRRITTELVALVRCVASLLDEERLLARGRGRGAIAAQHHRHAAAQRLATGTLPHSCRPRPAGPEGTGPQSRRLVGQRGHRAPRRSVERGGGGGEANCRIDTSEPCKPGATR